MSAGRFVTLFWEAGVIEVVEDDAHQLDTAVLAWMETRRDSILHLTLVDGDPFELRASLVEAWTLSTPEGRARRAEHMAAVKTEARANCLAAGLPWKDDEDFE